MLVNYKSGITSWFFFSCPFHIFSSDDIQPALNSNWIIGDSLGVQRSLTSLIKFVN